MSYRIFANHVFGCGPRRHKEEAPQDSLHHDENPQRPDTAIDPFALAILREPHHAKTIEEQYRAKESALARLFADLSPNDARLLRHRLDHPVKDDELALEFERLIAPRRQRLLVVLANASRRALLRGRTG